MAALVLGGVALFATRDSGRDHQTAPHVVALPRGPDSPVFAVPLSAGAVADPAAASGTNVVRVWEDPAGTRLSTIALQDDLSQGPLISVTEADDPRQPCPPEWREAGH
ncbi:MAG: hypothetical protein ABIW46_00265 [Acidimicrobiales bacterium]